MSAAGKHAHTAAALYLPLNQIQMQTQTQPESQRLACACNVTNRRRHAPRRNKPTCRHNTSSAVVGSVPLCVCDVKWHAHNAKKYHRQAYRQDFKKFSANPSLRMRFAAGISGEKGRGRRALCEV